LLTLRNINKEFESVSAVSDVSFEVNAGRIFGFLGPNGAGKTTTLRMIMNIIQPDTGEIFFNGSIQRPENRAFGYLPEERGLYQKFTLVEVLEYFAKLRNVSNPKPLIMNLLERFNLSDRAENKVSELSKGNQQKIQFINTILHDPQFIIMDEPFSGLDPVNQLLMKEILDELKSRGKTIILSSHQIDQVERICDDVALINRAKLVLSGDLKTIKRQYGEPILKISFVDETLIHHKKIAELGGSIKDNFVIFKVDTALESKHIISEIIELGETKEIKKAEPSLEEIFIKLVQGDIS
jgi:ABC-2 type transport system ATP-binding protein